MTKKIKKILLYILSILAFIMFILFYQYTQYPMLTKAYGNYQDNYSTPISVNTDDYYNVNLFNKDDSFITDKWIPHREFNFSNGEIGKTYTITSFSGNISHMKFAYMNYQGGENEGPQVWNLNSNHWTFTLENYTRFSININGNWVTDSDDLKLVILEGEQVADKYTEFYKFGYNVNVSIPYYSSSEIQTQSNIILKNNNKTIGSFALQYMPVSSSSSTKVITASGYIPFNINNNGNVSIDTNINITFDNLPSGINFNTNFEPYINFSPIFSATRKSTNETTNILDLKNVYVFNVIGYSNVSYNNNDTNSYIISTCDNYIKNNNVTNSINCSNGSNKNYLRFDNHSNFNVYNNETFELTQYDNINTNMIFFANKHNLTKFNSSLGFIVYAKTFTNNYSFNLSIGSLNVMLNNNSGSSVLPNTNGNNEYEKYNTCSAWYDIPCQLSNGLTYAVYHLPIISPVFSFVNMFIVIFKKLIDLIIVFSDFGIVFYVVLLFLFLAIINKFSK